MSEREAAVARLLGEADAAYGTAFPHAKRRDGGWPAWCAHWLMKRLPDYITVDDAELAAVLEALAGEHQNTPGAAPWPEFGAAQLLERLG
jgi:hypothetical protein